MTDFTPTEAQADAIAGLKDWFAHRTRDQQVFRVFGYAGTGKSTLVKHAIAELGLDDYAADSAVPNTLYGTFTGKAAHVLRRKGSPCRTIHSLIYSVSEATETEIVEAKQELAKLEKSLMQAETAIERLLLSAQVEALNMRLKDMKLPRWSLNEQSAVRDCKLLVLDEVSMVDAEMAAHVLSFEKPVLVLGDPGQLPPIRGAGAFTDAKPDAMLTEIHRQAAESAIIRLATMARQGQEIPYGLHDDDVAKMHRTAVSPEQLLHADQVICGRNATRLDLNNSLRGALGHRDVLPEGPAEKVICLKNDNLRGLINGMFLGLAEVTPFNEHSFKAKITNDEGEPIGLSENAKHQKMSVYNGHFIDHRELDPHRSDRDWRIKKRMVEATFGYAITCHKSQGSQWNRVAVWDDHLGRTPEDRARWLYTAITRAETGLVILD